MKRTLNVDTRIRSVRIRAMIALLLGLMLHGPAATAVVPDNQKDPAPPPPGVQYLYKSERTELAPLSDGILLHTPRKHFVRILLTQQQHRIWAQAFTVDSSCDYELTGLKARRGQTHNEHKPARLEFAIRGVRQNGWVQSDDLYKLNWVGRSDLEEELAAEPGAVLQRGTSYFVVLKTGRLSQTSSTKNTPEGLPGWSLSPELHRAGGREPPPYGLPDDHYDGFLAITLMGRPIDCDM